MKRGSLWIVVIFMLLASSMGYSAEKIQIYADVVNYNSKTGNTTAIGNVRVVKGNLTLTCLKAVANMNNRNVHLIGQVEAIDKDGGGKLWSDEAFYYSKDKMVKAVGSVKAVYEGYTLYAEILRYYIGKVRHYIATGKPAYILSKNGRLSGPEIEFKGDKAYVRGGVFYTSEKKGLNVTGTTATAYFEKRKVKKVEVYGNVHAIRKSRNAEFEAWGETLEYSVSDSMVVLTGNPRAKQGERMLLADRIEYNTDTDELKASGNARIVLPGEK